MDRNSFSPVVQVVRGDHVESIHLAAAAAVDADGRVVGSLGDPGLPVYLRSAAKPFQAWPLVDSGAAAAYGLTDEELALACASHGGEPRHVALAESMLARGGLTPDDLQCGPHAPMTRAAARALAAAGVKPTVLHNNCSGKHAGMLMLNAFLGGDKAGYLSAESPGQKAIRNALAQAAHVPSQTITGAVDGCSAPTFRLPLHRMARAYARLAVSLADPGRRGGLGRIAGAMSAHPGIVAGTGRLDTALMEARPDQVIAKLGAEGIYGVAALASGEPLGIALKIADGDADRARTALIIDLLAHLGVLQGDTRQAMLEAFPRQLRNRRDIPVGHIRVALPANWPGPAK